jgi:hypothetical protein
MTAPTSPHTPRPRATAPRPASPHTASPRFHPRCSRGGTCTRNRFDRPPVALLVLTAAALTVAGLPLLSCTSPEKQALEEPLQAAETFDWSEQPISFRPPPEDWRRNRYNQGGRIGVDFVHTGSVGERIYVAEYYQAGERAGRENDRYVYSVDDFLDEAIIDPETWSGVDSVWAIEEWEADIAGEPAHTLDFQMAIGPRQYFIREQYVMWNNHLFVASFLGLEVNLPLFERVVETITFPDPEGY